MWKWHISLKSDRVELWCDNWLKWNVTGWKCENGMIIEYGIEIRDMRTWIFIGLYMRNDCYKNGKCAYIQLMPMWT